MLRKLSKGQLGQTAMEYLLMVVVSIGLGITFKKKMTAYFLTNPNSFINKSLTNYKNLFAGRDSNGRPYKRFTVSRTRTR